MNEVYELVWEDGAVAPRYNYIGTMDDEDAAYDDSDHYIEREDDD